MRPWKKPTKFVAHSAVVSGVMATQAFAFRKAFNAPARVLPHPPKRLCQGRSARAEARAETKRVLTTKPTADPEAEAKAEKKARVAQHEAVGR